MDAERRIMVSRCTMTVKSCVCHERMNSCIETLAVGRSGHSSSVETRQPSQVNQLTLPIPTKSSKFTFPSDADNPRYHTLTKELKNEFRSSTLITNMAMSCRSQVNGLASAVYEEPRGVRCRRCVKHEARTCGTGDSVAKTR